MYGSKTLVCTDHAPTERFKISEPQGWSNDVSEQHKMCWSTDFEALRLWNVRPGGYGSLPIHIFYRRREKSPALTFHFFAARSISRPIASSRKLFPKEREKEEKNILQKGHQPSHPVGHRLCSHFLSLNFWSSQIEKNDPPIANGDTFDRFNHPTETLRNFWALYSADRAK